MTSDAMDKELADARAKLKSAQAAAAAPDASERDRSDLKLIEQECMALENRAKRDAGKATSVGDAKKKVDRQLDKALEETFPGSDPVSFVQAAPLKEADAALTSVEASRGPNAGRDKPTSPDKSPGKSRHDG